MQTKEQKCTELIFKKLEKISMLLGNLLNEVAETLNTKEYTDKLIEENIEELREKHKKQETGKLSYNPIKNTVTLYGSKDEFDKNFIKYLLEAMEIPADATIIFKPNDED